MNDATARTVLHTNQPLMEPLHVALQDMQNVTRNADAKWHRLTARERMGLFAALMQFTVYLPTIRPYFRANYKKVQKLHKLVVSAGKTKPISLAAQLQLALQIEPNLPNALWLILVTSRHYARWHDSEALGEATHVNQPAAQKAMLQWSDSIKGMKPHRPELLQDSAGDTYYVWTHAIAKVLYGPMSPWWAIDAHLYRLAIHFGTFLNSHIAHSTSPQSTPTGHATAAKYGNAIGRLLASR